LSDKGIVFDRLWAALLVLSASVTTAFGSAWHDMAKVCEDVILEQSSDPLRQFQPAPFSSGKPGQKEVAVYDPTKELVVVARLVGGTTWDQCFVRETDEDETRRRLLAEDWTGSLAAIYSVPPYLAVNAVLPDIVNPGVFRCDGGSYVLSVFGFFGRDFLSRLNHRERSARDNGRAFRVFVVKEPSERADALCEKGTPG
jgi:hypothetical protein